MSLEDAFRRKPQSASSVIGKQSAHKVSTFGANVRIWNFAETGLEMICVVHKTKWR